MPENLEVLALVHVFAIMPPILYALPVREPRNLAGMGDTSARGQRGHWLSWCIDGCYLFIRPFDFNRSLWMIVGERGASRWISRGHAGDPVPGTVGASPRADRRYTRSRRG